jgi:hypothetical protein
MDSKIITTASEIAEALLSLARGMDRLRNIVLRMGEELVEISNVENVDKFKGDSSLEVQKEHLKPVTLEELRERLIQLSRDGKYERVRTLVSKYGANKLSDIKKEKYAEMLREVETC